MPSVSRKASCAACLIAFLAMAGPVFGQTATIRDAWWSNQQPAGPESCWVATNGNMARLHWDPDVVDSAASLTVSERITYYECGDGIHYVIDIDPHVITGNQIDDLYVDIPMDVACTCWDYEIAVYRVDGGSSSDYIRDASNDDDLNDHRESTGLDLWISDAWWTNRADVDEDGCFRGADNGYATLHWDTYVVGGSGPVSVWFNVSKRACDADHWSGAVGTGGHIITGVGLLDVHESIPLDGFDCTCMDWRIQVGFTKVAWANFNLHPGTDEDLDDEFQEQRADDTRVTIDRVWWAAEQNEDRDLCWAGTGGEVAVLSWDPNVVGGNYYNSVFEQVFRRACGTDAWQVIAVTPTHEIFGNATDDQQSLLVPMHSGCTCYDYMIALQRVEEDIPDDIKYASAHWEESLGEDIVTRHATIVAAWWSNQQNNDGNDVCVSGANNQVRLNWDPDVAEGIGELTVYEYIYYKLCNSNSWVYAMQTQPHTITGAIGSDAQHVDLNTASSCACLDYRIDIFRSDQSVPDYTRDPSNDLNLKDHYEESLEEDVLKTWILNTW